MLAWATFLLSLWLPPRHTTALFSLRLPQSTHPENVVGEQLLVAVRNAAGALVNGSWLATMLTPTHPQIETAVHEGIPMRLLRQEGMWCHLPRRWVNPIPVDGIDTDHKYLLGSLTTGQGNRYDPSACCVRERFLTLSV